MRELVNEILKEIDPKFLDFEASLEDIATNDAFAVKSIIDESIEYNDRRSLFRKAITENIKYEDGCELCMEQIERCIVMLRLPYSFHKRVEQSNKFLVELKCRFGGHCKKKETRGIQCTFKLMININKNKENEFEVLSEHTEPEDVKQEKKKTHIIFMLFKIDHSTHGQ